MPSIGSWWRRESSSTSSRASQFGGSPSSKIAWSSTSTRMNRAPIAFASAKMRSFIAAGVQQVWTIACEEIGAPGRAAGAAAVAGAAATAAPTSAQARAGPG
jgi:hypothetical protein